jgi:phosphate transport system substrate-binding protein
MRNVFFIAFLFLLLGCSTEKKETTTRGNLHIFIPESIAPVMIDEVNEFMSLYKANGAQITFTIVSAEQAAQRFIHDTTRIVFLPHALKPYEKDSIDKASPALNELVVAYDGILAVVHPTNTIEQVTTTQIQKILSGTISQWKQLAVTKPMKGVIKIYCQDSSDVTEYLTQRLVRQYGITANVTHTTSDLHTLQSVEKDPFSIGFVALGWFDSTKSTVKILNLGRTHEDIDTTFTPPANAAGKFFSRHPANIFLNYYPLKRAIYMYSRGQVDLAAGFGTYVATAEGQKLFLKRGLLPGTQKIKLISNQPY